MQKSKGRVHTSFAFLLEAAQTKAKGAKVVC